MHIFLVSDQRRQIDRIRANVLQIQLRQILTKSVDPIFEQPATEMEIIDCGEMNQKPALTTGITKGYRS